MQSVVLKRRSFAIAYDASLVDDPTVELFSPELWAFRNALDGEAVGRGSTLFINAPFGPAVLREYLRGGWVAKVSQRNYFFTTVARSRPFREFNILADLHGQGLPVPRPVAALCEHRGLTSTGSIITMRIEHTGTLADLLPGDVQPDDNMWENVGRCIRQLHRAGAWHADLNARNILLDGEMKAYLIDFDRARLMPGTEVNGKRNLERLKRSLEKLWPEGQRNLLQPAWNQLLAAYYV